MTTLLGGGVHPHPATYRGFMDTPGGAGGLVEYSTAPYTSTSTSSSSIAIINHHHQSSSSIIIRSPSSNHHHQITQVNTKTLIIEIIIHYHYTTPPRTHHYHNKKKIEEEKKRKTPNKTTADLPISLLLKKKSNTIRGGNPESTERPRHAAPALYSSTPDEKRERDQESSGRPYRTKTRTRPPQQTDKKQRYNKKPKSRLDDERVLRRFQLGLTSNMGVGDQNGWGCSMVGSRHARRDPPHTTQRASA